MSRNEIKKFQDIPNVGKAIEKNFILLGIQEPFELIGMDPYQMYNDLRSITGSRLDPCIIDVFMSVIDFMEGGEPSAWWEFTSKRKKLG